MRCKRMLYLEKSLICCWSSIIRTGVAGLYANRTGSSSRGQRTPGDFDVGFLVLSGELKGANKAASEWTDLKWHYDRQLE